MSGLCCQFITWLIKYTQNQNGPATLPLFVTLCRCLSLSHRTLVHWPCQCHSVYYKCTCRYTLVEGFLLQTSEFMLQNWQRNGKFLHIICHWLPNNEARESSVKATTERPMKWWSRSSCMQQDSGVATKPLRWLPSIHCMTLTDAERNFHEINR